MAVYLNNFHHSFTELRSVSLACSYNLPALHLYSPSPLQHLTEWERRGIWDAWLPATPRTTILVISVLLLFYVQSTRIKVSVDMWFYTVCKSPHIIKPHVLSSKCTTLHLFSQLCHWLVLGYMPDYPLRSNALFSQPFRCIALRHKPHYHQLWMDWWICWGWSLYLLQGVLGQIFCTCLQIIIVHRERF